MYTYLVSELLTYLDALPDLQLDHPHAPELLADYLERCVGLELLTPAGSG